MYKKICLVSVITFLLLGCAIAPIPDYQRATPPQEPDIIKASTDPDVSAPDYKLQPGDHVNVSIFQEPDLSGEVKLDERGRAQLPLIGSIRLAGLGLDEAAQLIEMAYRTGYLKQPDVTLKVTGHHPVYVMGAVKKPGAYPYHPDMRVVQALAAAGGPNFDAKGQIGRISGYYDTKLPDGGSLSFREAEAVSVDERLSPGDVLIVKDRLF